jgi:uncharacterized membrane protein
MSGMDSHAKVLGHSVHEILIVFPLGLLATAIVFDAVHLATGNPTMAVVAYWMIVAGLVGGVVAAPFGWVDWRAIPARTRAKRVGRWHAITNAIVLVLFAGSWLLRRDAPDAPGIAASVLSFAGAALATVGGWLGGELVSRLGVAVYEGAHLDAPSSLSGRPASERATPGGPELRVTVPPEERGRGAGIERRG